MRIFVIVDRNLIYGNCKTCDLRLREISIVEQAGGTFYTTLIKRFSDHAGKYFVSVTSSSVHRPLLVQLLFGFTLEDQNRLQ